MAKIGVILSGSGVYDGGEIHESVLTLLAIKKSGHDYVCMAPNKDQMHVIDHLSGSETSERRNVLNESARIARGEVDDIKKISAKDIDALILPGGFGAAKNLSTFATEGADCNIDADVQRIVKEVYNAKKPIGAMCIAPAVVARAFKEDNIKPKLTIGTDKGTAEKIEALGAEHIESPATDCVVDKEHKIVTAPAYMNAKDIAEAEQGISKLVKEISNML